MGGDMAAAPISPQWCWDGFGEGGLTRLNSWASSSLVTQQVWNQEQPLMDESEQTQIDLAQQQEASLQQMSQEAGQQWNMYEQDYAPLEEKYLGQVSDWASPGEILAARPGSGDERCRRDGAARA